LRIQAFVKCFLFPRLPYGNDTEIAA